MSLDTHCKIKGTLLIWELKTTLNGSKLQVSERCFPRCVSVAIVITAVCVLLLIKMRFRRLKVPE